MKRAFRLSDIVFNKNSVVSVGLFDGVHRGHQVVIQDVVHRARVREGRSVIVTFDPHPREVLGKDTQPFKILSTVDERADFCRDLGIDLFFVLSFDYEFSRLSSRFFFQKYLIEGIGVSEVVEGYDHHFGRDREGGAEALLRLGKEFDFTFVALKPVTVDGGIVSSSRIRSLIADGEVERSAYLLGRPYALAGTVVPGDGRGKTLGFPTANIDPENSRKLLPKDGIYVVQVDVEGRREFGMTSIGLRPTFHESGDRTVEVNVLNFDGDLYGRQIRIAFLKRLREERKFRSVDELVKQMTLDREASQRYIEELERTSGRTALYS